MHANGVDAALNAMNAMKSTILTDLTQEELSSLDISDTMKQQCPKSLVPPVTSDASKAKWQSISQQIDASVMMLYKFDETDADRRIDRSLTQVR